MLPDLKEMNRRYWDGVPKELRFMCLNEAVGTGNMSCASSAIAYLVGRLDECDEYSSGTSAWDMVKWIDITFESCMFPLELHEDDWLANLDSIQLILDKEEKLLFKVSPKYFNYGHRVPDDENFRFNSVMYWQKLGVYYCVLYMYKKDDDGVENCFYRILTDTNQNLDYLLTLEDAWKYATENEGLQYTTPDFYKWETINKLYGQDLPTKKAYQLYMEHYDVYRRDLVELRCETNNAKVCNYLITKANKRFQHLKMQAFGYGYAEEDEDDEEGDVE